MPAERDPLDEFLGPVADGTPVDWDSAVRGATPSQRPRVENLRDVSRIADFSRNLQRGSESEIARAGGRETGSMPQRWGELLLLERIGVGAHADVYRAWDPKLLREVALKLIRPDARGGSADTGDSPLLEEGRAAARIRHPHVVAILGIDRHDGRVGLWMELVRGTTLEREVRSRGPLPASEAVRLGVEIGAALAAVHTAGLLHRDVKPANVVRDAEGRYVLTDFGLGVRWDDAAAQATWPSGTPMYMAPELLVGAPPNVRSDVYSLGLLLWFALAGRHPFVASTFSELRAAAAGGPAPGLLQVRPDVPAPLAEIVERAIAPVPESRVVSAQLLVDALRGWQQTAAPAARRLHVPHATRRTRVLAGVAVVATLAAFGVWRTRVGPVDTHVGGSVPATSPGAANAPGGDAAPGGTAPQGRAAFPVASATPATAGAAGGPAAAEGTYAAEASFLRRDAGAALRLVTGDRVSPGDRLSLEVRATRAAWVYVLNEDDRGERFLLFPQPRFDMHNPLPADSTFVLPGTIAGHEQAWTVTSRGGREYFLLVVSPEPVPELEADLGRLPAPAPDRPIEYAAVGTASVERLRGTGGLAELPASTAEPAPRSRAFDRFRALAGRETSVRGLWVRQIVLENPLR
jgi:hypothetical protein